MVLLMEEILHQLMNSFFHHLQGFIHPRWCRISFINSIKHMTCIFKIYYGIYIIIQSSFTILVNMIINIILMNISNIDIIDIQKHKRLKSHPKVTTELARCIPQPAYHNVALFCIVPCPIRRLQVTKEVGK